MELNENTIKSAYKLMEMITKGYHWYHDTPEQPFEYSEGSIWLINPETEEWMIELEKSGHLSYYYETHVIFSKYLNMEKSDFESFIKIWVEDVLKRGVVSTHVWPIRKRGGVKDALERGVVSTTTSSAPSVPLVEDVLKRGVVSTSNGWCRFEYLVEDVIKNGKKWN